MTYSFMEEIKKRGLDFDDETGEDLILHPIKSGGYAVSVHGNILGACSEEDYTAVIQGDFSKIKRFGLSVNDFHAQMLHATVSSNPDIIEDVIFKIAGRNPVFYPQAVSYDPQNKRLVVTLDSGY